jgi:acyl-CoA reductase-like NAD-dependent aldehyde dehydrogenase
VANQRVVKNYINGKSQESLSGQFTDLINPTTGEVFGKAALSD